MRPRPSLRQRQRPRPRRAPRCCVPPPHDLPLLLPPRASTHQVDRHRLVRLPRAAHGRVRRGVLAVARPSCARHGTVNASAIKINARTKGAYRLAAPRARAALASFQGRVRHSQTLKYFFGGISFVLMEEKKVSARGARKGYPTNCQYAKQRSTFHANIIPYEICAGLRDRRTDRFFFFYRMGRDLGRPRGAARHSGVASRPPSLAPCCARRRRASPARPCGRSPAPRRPRAPRLTARVATRSALWPSATRRARTCVACAHALFRVGPALPADAREAGGRAGALSAGARVREAGRRQSARALAPAASRLRSTAAELAPPA